jgi:hypothetical protein
MFLSKSLLRRPSAIALAVGGLALSTVSILAADLGASCCVDLEERIAELEATTASKGNRKMSLAISGSVNRVVLCGMMGEARERISASTTAQTSQVGSYSAVPRI